MTSSLLDLAARVERLTGPCRETDCLIFESRHRLLTPERRGMIDGEPTGQYFNINGDLLPEVAPAYTASLDAAMTLARNNREAMLMIHAAFGSFESDEMDGVPNIFPRIKAMLLTNIRARAALESSHE